MTPSSRAEHERLDHGAEKPSSLHGMQRAASRARVSRTIGRFVRRAAPVLRSVARTAAPIIGAAKQGSRSVRAASCAIDDPFPSEDEIVAYLEALRPQRLSARQVLAESTAAHASAATSSQESDSLTAAAAALALSEAGPAIRASLPEIVRRTVILAGILRRRSTTRPAIRAVPTIVRRTARALSKDSARSRSASRSVGTTLANETCSVLAEPYELARALQSNILASSSPLESR